MRRGAALAALLVLAAAVPAAGSAQEAIASRNRGTLVVDQRLDARFPTVVSERLATIIAAAGAEGLPTEPLILRALEGGAKRVPPEKIEEALVRMHHAMRQAAATIGQPSDATELSTAASAIQAGLAVERIGALKTARGIRTLAVPLATWLELVARGADPDRAWQRIDDLARRGAADRDYSRIEAADLMRRPKD